MCPALLVDAITNGMLYAISHSSYKLQRYVRVRRLWILLNQIN